MEKLSKIKELKLNLDLDFEIIRRYYSEEEIEELKNQIKNELIDILEKKKDLNKTKDTKIKLFLNDKEFKDKKEIKMLLSDKFDYLSDSSSDSL